MARACHGLAVLVGGSGSEEEGRNMDFTTIAQHGIEVPVLCSVCDIPAHTRLVYFVRPKAKAEPLQNVIKAADGDAPPSKKATALAMFAEAISWLSSSSPMYTRYV